MFPTTLIVALPSAVVDSYVATFLFKKVASSKSAILMRLLTGAPLKVMKDYFIIRFVASCVSEILYVTMTTILVATLHGDVGRGFT